jgi:hypothetical protein
MLLNIQNELLMNKLMAMDLIELIHLFIIFAHEIYEQLHCYCIQKHSIPHSPNHDSEPIIANETKSSSSSYEKVSNSTSCYKTDHTIITSSTAELTFRFDFLLMNCFMNVKRLLNIRRVGRMLTNQLLQFYLKVRSLILPGPPLVSIVPYPYLLTSVSGSLAINSYILYQSSVMRCFKHHSYSPLASDLLIVVVILFNDISISCYQHCCNIIQLLGVP